MSLDPLRARLALIRGNLDRVEALLDGSEKWSWRRGYTDRPIATRLDAFVAVGRAEEAVEDAERYAIPGTYLEPFALRTLGIAGRRFGARGAGAGALRSDGPRVVCGADT